MAPMVPTIRDARTLNSLHLCVYLCNLQAIAVGVQALGTYGKRGKA